MSDDLIAKISQTMNITQQEQLIFIFITKLPKGFTTCHTSNWLLLFILTPLQQLLVTDYHKQNKLTNSTEITVVTNTVPLFIY